MSLGDFQTNFSRGQLSTRIQTRIDTKSYRDGAKTLSNVLVMLQGGARARCGSHFRARLENAGTPLTATGCRLEPLVIDRDEVYILAFTDARLDIYRLTTASVTLSASLTTQPWDATSMWFMTVLPHGSIAIICDQSFQPRLLTRSGLDTFSIAAFTFESRIDDDEEYQPYHKYADNDVTLAISAYTVGVGRTLTASSAVFDADHIGKRFLIRDGEVEITAVASGTSATCDVVREIRALLDPNPFTSHPGSGRTTCTWVDHGLSASDTIDIQGSGRGPGTTAQWNVDGAQTVTEVIDKDRFDFTEGTGSWGENNEFGGSDVWVRTTAATRDWQEPAFSAYRGWPQAAEIQDGRLWFAGPPGVPTGRWGSIPGNFFNFRLGDGQPGDAVKAVSSTGGGQIRHLISASDLEVFSESGEAFMPSGIDEPINQANVRARPQTRHGAAYTRPIRFDGSTLFVDAVGQHVREFIYSADGKVYNAPPITALAPEVIAAPKHATVFDGASEDATPYAIYTNTDGTAAFLHSAREEGIAGWTKQTTTGTFLSFAGAGERLFCAVTRGTEMFLEEWDFDYIARADGCETLTNGVATTNWQATKDYLFSATVDVFDENGVFLGQTTTDALGNFVSGSAVTKVYVGLTAAWTLETLPPAMQLPDGPVLGSRNMISEAILFLINTDKIKVGETTKTYTSPVTGPKAFRVKGWRRDPTVPVSGTIASNAFIAGIRAEVY